MEESSSPTPEREFTLPEPNPVTRESHRKDFFRRVTLPLILILLGLIAVIVTFAIIPVGDVEAWSQISTIMLISLVLVLGLISLAILILLVYLVSYLLKLLPPYTRIAQDGIEQIKTHAEKGAEIPVKPIIQVQGFIAAINTLFRRKS